MALPISRTLQEVVRDIPNTPTPAGGMGLTLDASGFLPPLSGSRLILIARASDERPLTLRAAPSPTADVFQIQDSTEAVKAKVDSSFNITFQGKLLQGSMDGSVGNVEFVASAGLAPLVLKRSNTAYLRLTDSDGTNKGMMNGSGQWEVAMVTLAGAISDTAFNITPVSGFFGVDTTNSKFYVRVGSTWKSVTLT